MHTLSCHDLLQAISLNKKLFITFLATLILLLDNVNDGANNGRDTLYRKLENE